MAQRFIEDTANFVSSATISSVRSALDSVQAKQDLEEALSMAGKARVVELPVAGQTQVMAIISGAREAFVAAPPPVLQEYGIQIKGAASILPQVRLAANHPLVSAANAQLINLISDGGLNDDSNDMLEMAKLFAITTSIDALLRHFFPKNEIVTSVISSILPTMYRGIRHRGLSAFLLYGWKDVAMELVRKAGEIVVTKNCAHLPAGSFLSSIAWNNFFSRVAGLVLQRKQEKGSFVSINYKPVLVVMSGIVTIAAAALLAGRGDLSKIPKIIVKMRRS
uniref:Uncharacterized protein n=1 Tax=Palpitomonas bilix TaxID=652834 RepID=A0A7S3G3Y5_9EUKA|mmetsp:Transcript_23602/g.59482  ORF Transcript_23602/g.59482 Transcript_23602/m.59482 type:complete len:279 (+) Transcript_23602:173-1009(+)|eukprot:CAMPEP_0113915630 /NCGR_PEP_ID=MMETSP0780_2-20120614/31397_1 /TAXON_ID=652834 /ORGANISM="Palpitomonas bilix" /LENGTH=278 /DNA_ID=CAMNT_0000914337 /DNA_START=174 /DNA_END=1010 /DNA_ORIENTATION=+ /assembly_acc=CAM_ASM_000599